MRCAAGRSVPRGLRGAAAGAVAVRTGGACRRARGPPPAWTRARTGQLRGRRRRGAAPARPAPEHAKCCRHPRRPGRDSTAPPSCA
eukprot:4960140-Lingulodinium_polyedra.AAC.1